jgi:hypothetical protein
VRTALVTALLAGAMGAGAGDGLRLVLDPGPVPAAFVEVEGLTTHELARLRAATATEGWAGLFAVYTGSGPPAPDHPPVLGEATLAGERLRFTPRYPFVAGQPYLARLVVPGGRTAELAFVPPPPALSPITVVEAVYPSAPVVPENLLKLYLHFSAPMSRGVARHHLHLLADDGREVAAAFVAPEHELWDPEGRRLTLFFDPGRLKRGVGPHQELGPPLAAGRGYRLVVERDFPDAAGNPLTRGFEHAFQVGPADRTAPRWQDWRVEPPAGPTASLVVVFPEALDRALLSRLMAVLGADGEPVAGRTEIAAGETRWSFHPQTPWRPGRYRVAVDNALEDLAGNSLRRVFDLDLLERGGPASDSGPAVIEIPFEVDGGGPRPGGKKVAAPP